MSALVSLLTWFLAAITMTAYSIITEPRSAESQVIVLVEGLRVFVGCIIGGIITAAIIFFITEAKCRQIWPYFFPEGGLASTPGAFRLKLRTRMFVIFVLASILPLILMAVLSFFVAIAGLFNMLPVTVMGLGTREGTFLVLFKPMARSKILAFSGLVFLVAQIGGGLLSLVLGQIFLGMARREKLQK